jgi:hypothetical protein
MVELRGTIRHPNQEKNIGRTGSVTGVVEVGPWPADGEIRLWLVKPVEPDRVLRRDDRRFATGQYQGPVKRDGGNRSVVLGITYTTEYSTSR